MQNSCVLRMNWSIVGSCAILASALCASAATVTVDAPAGATVVSDPLAGADALVVNANGAGTVILNGASKTTGEITVVKGTLRVEEGAIESGAFNIGDEAQASSEPVRFEMTGGKVTLPSTSDSLMIAQGSHVSTVSVDISGGEFRVGKNLGVAYSAGNNKKIVDIVIRNGAQVIVPNTTGRRFYFDSTHAASKLTLVVKDGGVLTTPQLCRFRQTAVKPKVLFDGAFVNWTSNGTENPFLNGTYTLTDEIEVGDGGVVFTGSSSGRSHVYTTPLVASADGTGTDAAGVTFAQANYTLSAANSYNGQTVISANATVFARTEAALPRQTALRLRGRLDLVRTSPVSVASVEGSGSLALYEDEMRSSLVSAEGTYPMLKVPLTERENLLNFASSVRSENGGVFLVSESEETLTLNLVIGASAIQPTCHAEAVSDASSVTWACVGQTEVVGEEVRIVPNTYAVLAASDASGRTVSYWKDDSTGERLWGETVSLFVTHSTTYTAVFGKPWIWDAASKTVSNGEWSFGASVDGEELTLETPTAVGADGILNLAAPVRDVSGRSYSIVQLGKEAKSAFFYAADESLRQAVTAVYLPRGLRTIGASAFRTCSNLVKVEPFLPDTVTTVAANAFSDAIGLQGSLRAEGLTQITFHAFYRTQAMSGDVWLPNVTNVGAAAFYRSAAANFYFGTNQVSFVSETDPSDTNLQTFYRYEADSRVVRRFVFPGKAPLLPEGSDGSHAAGWRIFGAANGYDCLCGSWRIDPEGWRRLRSAFGSSSLTGKTPVPELCAGERSLKGTFCWEVTKDSTPLWGWLIDRESPNEPAPPGLILIFK